MTKPPNEQSRDQAVPAWRRYGVQLLLALAAFWLITRWQTAGSLGSGQAAPELAGKTLQGEQVQLSAFAGRPVLLHFWAPWCGVCRREFGMLRELHQHWREQGEEFVLLTVVSRRDAEGLADFVRAHDLDYPIAVTDPQALSAYRVNAFPTNYFIDRNGQIADVSVGMSTRWALSSRMARLR